MFAPPDNSDEANTPTEETTTVTTTGKTKPSNSDGNLWLSECNKQKPDEEYTILISVRGLPKVGKTHLLSTSLDLEEQDFLNFHFSGGKPCYILDPEHAFKIELQHHYKNLVENKDYYLLDPVVKNGKKIDYVKSWHRFQALVDNLSNVKEGILIIDGMGFIADATYYILVTEMLHYTFDEYNKPSKDLQPKDYTWRKKEIREFFTNLRHMKIPVIFSNKVKKETTATTNEKTGKDYFKYTGNYIEDSQEGTDYYYDMEITLEKEISLETLKPQRVAKIYDSRFEEEEIPLTKYTIPNPTMTKIFNRIKEVLNG